MSLSMVDIMSPSIFSTPVQPQSSKRKTAHQMKTNQVKEIPTERRVLKPYMGNSDYRRNFWDVYVKQNEDSAETSAIQTAVIQCKKCNMLMRNEGGHIKNHVISTCQKRLNKDQFKPTPSPSATALIKEEPLRTLPNMEVDLQNLQTPNSSKISLQNPLFSTEMPSESIFGNIFPEAKLTENMQILEKTENIDPLSSFMEMIVKNCQNQPLNFSTGKKEKSTGKLEKISKPKKPKKQPVTRRQLRENMLRTKDMERISRDRFVLKEYCGTSDYRKEFFDVWVKSSAEENDELAVETAVILCKNCERIMSNEGGHIKSHVRSACKGASQPQTPETTSKSPVVFQPTMPVQDQPQSSADLLNLLLTLTQLKSQPQLFPSYSSVSSRPVKTEPTLHDLNLQNPMLNPLILNLLAGNGL